MGGHYGRPIGFSTQLRPQSRRLSRRITDALSGLCPGSDWGGGCLVNLTHVQHAVIAPPEYGEERGTGRKGSSGL